MKIWYQSMTAEGGNGAYIDEVRRLISDATPAGCEVTIAGIPDRSLHSDHQFRFYEYTDTRHVIANALRAEQEGYSAFLIGNIADPGLHQVRELTRFPVLGLGEMSFFLGLQMGRRLGLVAITDMQAVHMREKVHELGIDQHLAGIETLDLRQYSDLNSAYAQSANAPMLDAFAARARHLRTLGADVILPVGGLVMALLSRAGVTAIDGSPVINGVYPLAALGAALGALYDTQGHFTSKTLSYAPPPGEAMAEILAQFSQVPK